MDLTRLLQSLVQRFLGQFLNHAARRGIDHLASGGKTRAEMTPAERAQAKQARSMAKRAQQIARMARRLR